MRDPARIDPIIDALRDHWHRVPDWRFGQLVSNLYASVGRDGDLFFPEDGLIEEALNIGGHDARHQNK